MKNFLFLVYFLFLPVLVSAQDKNLITEEFPSYHVEINNLQIDLTKNSINITKEGTNLFSENISGRKNLQISNSEKYFLISNYAFPSDKSDYRITLELFNNKSEQQFKTEITAPFDLPHPLFSLNDDGVIASFDPITFKLELIDKENKREVNLEKNISPEMERTVFIQMNNESVFVIASLKALSTEENEPNVKLYKINISNLENISSSIDYSIPTLLKLFNNKLIISGIKFQNSIPEGKTSMLNLDMETISSKNYSLEKIIDSNLTNGQAGISEKSDFYFGKYGSSVYTINKNNLSLIKSYKFNNDEHIEDIAALQNNLTALVLKNNSFYLYNFELNLNISNYSEIKLNFVSKPLLQKMNGKIFLLNNETTNLLR